MCRASRYSTERPASFSRRSAWPRSRTCPSWTGWRGSALNRNSETGGIRLQVFLARCGLGSRRACDVLATSGRVAINGARVTRAGEKVLPTDVVTLDGRKLAAAGRQVYIALHKPPGFL